MHTCTGKKWVSPKPLQAHRALQLLEESAKTGQYTNDGPCVKTTELYLQSFFRLQSAKRVLLAASGTAALHALVAGFNIKHGRKLVWATQAMTFPSSVLGPLNGALVVDNDELAYGPSLHELTRVVDAIDGIIVTNQFGTCCDLNAYVKWCRTNKKLLVLDNAATPLTFVDGALNSCSFGDGAIVSFHETKPIGRGEGGAIICNDDMYDCVHRALNFGFAYGKHARTHHPEASNWRMSDIAAAFIRARLELFTGDDFVRIGRLVTAIDEFLQLPDVCPHLRWLIPPVSPATTFLACIPLVTSAVVDIDVFHCETGIECKKYYRPLRCREDTPVAWDWYTNCICLPFPYECDNPDDVLHSVKRLLGHVLDLGKQDVLLV